jgi:hypothetical protein
MDDEKTVIEGTKYIENFHLLSENDMQGLIIKASETRNYLEPEKCTKLKKIKTDKIWKKKGKNNSKFDESIQWILVDLITGQNTGYVIRYSRTHGSYEKNGLYKK